MTRVFNQGHQTTSAAVTLAVLLTLIAAGTSVAQESVDFRYAPHKWFTPIGLIDDWQKSLVDQDGRLTYDFGPGPYAVGKTTIAVVPSSGPADTTLQTLFDPRIPVVLSRHAAQDKNWSQIAFGLVPRAATIRPSDTLADGLASRAQGLVGSVAWGSAIEGVDVAFQSVAWGTGRSIEYNITVPPHEARRIALGFREVYRRGRIKRTMDLIVEGAGGRSVDLIEVGARDEPQVFFFNASDVDGDGSIHVEVTPTRDAQDPNVFLNGIWVFDEGSEVEALDVVSGRAREVAETVVDAGTELRREGIVRMDVIRTVFDRAASVRADAVDPDPRVLVTTLRSLVADPAHGVLAGEGGHPFIMTSPHFAHAERTASGWELTFAPGTRAVDVVAVEGRAPNDLVFPDLDAEFERTVDYWQDADLPWGRLRVPDEAIQGLIDGGIRTAYQIREVVDGYPQFQPGPSVYRGLWYGDSQWAVEAFSFVDDGAAARAALEGMMRYQRVDGRAGVMKPALLHRETAHLVFGAIRYARLFRDWTWLDEHWDSIRRGVDYLIALREQTLDDTQTLYHGLFPPGLTDGGIGGIGPSYGSIYWGLIALAEASRAAEILDREEAARWSDAYNAFDASFRSAVARDARTDADGNLFLPVKMDFDPDVDEPQRGQWGVFHALYIGQIYADDDPLVTGTMRMLEDRTVDGLVVTPGWLDGGVWPIFDAHRAMAYNWLGDADKVEEILYAFANHAAPTGVWVEEQMPRGSGTRTTGDVPHTVGNMQVIRLIRTALLLEKDGDLELLRSMPLRWLRAGSETRLAALPTYFGPVTIRVTVDSDGQGGAIWGQLPVPDDRWNKGTARLGLHRIRSAGFTHAGDGSMLPDHVTLEWGEPFHIRFSRR